MKKRRRKKRSKNRFWCLLKSNFTVLRSWLKLGILLDVCKSLLLCWWLCFHSFCSAILVATSLNNSRILAMQFINWNGTDCHWTCKRTFEWWLHWLRNGFTCVVIVIRAQRTPSSKRYQFSFRLGKEKDQKLLPH